MIHSLLFLCENFLYELGMDLIRFRTYVKKVWLPTYYAKNLSAVSLRKKYKKIQN